MSRKDGRYPLGEQAKHLLEAKDKIDEMLSRLWVAEGLARVEGAKGVWMDIEAKQEALFEARDKLMKVVDLLPDGMIV